MEHNVDSSILELEHLRYFRTGTATTVTLQSEKTKERERARSKNFRGARLDRLDIATENSPALTIRSVTRRRCGMRDYWLCVCFIDACYYCTRYTLLRPLDSEQNNNDLLVLVPGR